MIENVRSKKFGIAFGGGGAKGLAHLGLVKFFWEHNLLPAAISGSSIGSFVGAMYAFGLSYTDMLNAFNKLEPFSFMAIKPGALGVMENVSLKKVVQEYLPNNCQIEDAKIPLAIHTTDIVTGEPVDLLKGSVLDAILASSCVPGIYIPKKIDGRLLIDGGITENVPVSCLNQFDTDFVIAMNLNGQEEYNQPDSIMDVIKNSMDIAIDRQTKYQIKSADIVVNLDLSRFSRIKVRDINGIMQVTQDTLEGIFFK